MIRGLAIAAVLMLAIAPASALSNAAPYRAPRLFDGRPDLGGLWDNRTATTFEREPGLGLRRALTEAEAAKLEDAENLERLRRNHWGYTPTSVMRVAGEPRASLITRPTNGRVPAPRPGAQVQPAPTSTSHFPLAYRDPPQPPARLNDPEDAGPVNRCIVAAGRQAGPILLPEPFFNTYHLVQGRETLAIWIEMNHDVRVIRIGGKHRTDGVRPYWGDSIGRWQGDTLVVETTNFPATTNLYGSSARLTLTERFTRVSPTRLLYQFEARDLSVWDQPWGGEYEFEAGRNQVYEYACHEGNYGLEKALAESRAAERGS